MTVQEALQNGECVTREMLIVMTGQDDRQNRADIAKLRRKGVWVVNGLNGGYRITDDPQE